MENELIFIRHAKTKKDKDIPIEDWVLTEEGEKQAEEIANSGEFDDVEILISSNENKSYLTIKPLADKLNLEVIKVKDLGEIKRPDSERLTTEEYEKVKKMIFKDLNFTKYGWETANNALNRFKNAVDEINQKYENKKILICSHGTVMTLYFAYLLNKLNDLMNRWKSLEFGSHGIVKNNKVVEDIV
ncbi:MAG: histidine phosphatase family protein [Nanoarchaeota archaeon]|nr:histidine phosphatase family protein [Nanoarchaeota archaeon]